MRDKNTVNLGRVIRLVFLTMLGIAAMCLAFWAMVMFVVVHHHP
ncbi:MAG TPA: hypothetical protein VMP11_00855 [Verrucomicrobiae bacterium]|nr:hypothetical protein [Verrucomicrobiae bacterium]